MCAKFQVFIIFRLPGDVTHINKYTNIRVNLRISSTGWSPHVDFDSARDFTFKKIEIETNLKLGVNPKKVSIVNYTERCGNNTFTQLIQTYESTFITITSILEI